MSTETEVWDETQIGKPVEHEGFLIRVLECWSPGETGGKNIHGWRAEWKKNESGAEVKPGDSVYSDATTGTRESAVEWAKSVIRKQKQK